MKTARWTHCPIGSTVLNLTARFTAVYTRSARTRFQSDPFLGKFR